jgi:deferrochelatase/peroxidase EfeB
MTNTTDFEFDDLQGLLRFGYRDLTDTCFLLLSINDVNAAKKWLASAPVNSAAHCETTPDTALHIAFSAAGLAKFGLNATVLGQFSEEFLDGMASDPNRSRRLGDVGDNSPEHWKWGSDAEHPPHVLLLLYAKPGHLESLRQQVEIVGFDKAFKMMKELPTHHHGEVEPFGFVDGISQPTLDWQHQQAIGGKGRNQYSNLLAVGEVVLGYPNEYGQYTNRPLIDPANDALAGFLADAEDKPALKDFARNGTYLVLRQLHQDVIGFWRFIDKAAGGDVTRRNQLAAAMVGRNRDGTPLVPLANENIPGTASDDQLNRFIYAADPKGQQCPLGAHIRRSNPRTADLPSNEGGFWSRLWQSLGFKQTPDNDLVASTRFHRLLRRGRSYGLPLSPENALKPNAQQAERGLQFICLVANISRQFEFVQNAWLASSKFNAAQQEQDPLLGNRHPLLGGEATDHFNHPQPAGPRQTTCHLPQFITVRGGAYFFMPGLRALKYLATLPAKG